MSHITWPPADPTYRTSEETPRANRALRDYCFLGCNRSLEKLREEYISTPDAPTRSLDTLKKWSLNFDWNARARKFDENERREENSLLAERRRSIIETGLALRHERVEKLKHAYAELEPYLSRTEFVWPRQIKRLPTPDGGFELVEMRRFNAEIFIQLRGILADIAREANGPDPAESIYADNNHFDLSLLTDEETETLEDILLKQQGLPPIDRTFRHIRLAAKANSTPS